jgi:hypothetical protein
MRSPCFEWLIVLWAAAAAACGPLANAADAAQVAVDLKTGTAVCEYSEGSEQPLIDYQTAFGELAATEAVPRLRVFGDGRVEVHRPPFMKKAGDYERWLSRRELDELVASLAANGVFDFDENRVDAARGKRLEAAHAREAAEGRAVTLSYAADEDVTTLTVFLERYTPADPGLPVRRNLAKRISWRNPAADVRRNPQIPEIVRMAAAFEAISRLAEHEDLQRIDH